MTLRTRMKMREFESQLTGWALANERALVCRFRKDDGFLIWYNKSNLMYKQSERISIIYAQKIQYLMQQSPMNCNRFRHKITSIEKLLPHVLI